MTTPASEPGAPFRLLADLVRQHARARPGHAALQDETHALTCADLDALMDRIAAALQAAGVRPGEAIAVCAQTSVRYAALFLGALRAGVVVAPLAPSSTADALAAMLRDAQARLLFTDAATFTRLPRADALPPTISLDGAAVGQRFDDWLDARGKRFIRTGDVGRFDADGLPPEHRCHPAPADPCGWAG